MRDDYEYGNTECLAGLECADKLHSGLFILVRVVLLIWAGFILFGRQFVYRLHGSFFKLSNEQFDMIHYTAMAAYKLLILVFNLVPFVVLQFIV